MPKKTDYWPIFTKIRFPLAIWVVLHHTLDFNIFNSLDSPPVILKIIAQTGSLAPTVFFLLSGFVIARFYSSKDTLTNREFFLSRFLTLYPYYFITLLVFIFSPHSPIERERLPWHLLGLQAFLPSSNWFTLNSPSWSLSVEFFLYLTFPYFFHLVTKIKMGPGRLLAFIITTEVTSTLLIAKFFNEDDEFYLIYHFPIFQLFHFLEGVLCFLIVTNAKRTIPIPKYLSLVIISVFFSIGILSSYLINFNWVKLGILLVLPTVSLLLLIPLSEVNGSMSKGLPHLITLKAGEASYLIYITHWAWVGTLRKILAPISDILTLTLLFSLLLVLITFSLVLVQEFSASKLKNISKLSLKNPSPVLIAILSFLVLFNLNSNSPREWSVDTLPSFDEIRVDISQIQYFVQDSVLVFEVKLENNSEDTIDLAFCYFVTKDYASNNADQFNVHKEEIFSTLDPEEVGTFELKFLMNDKKYTLDSMPRITGTCDGRPRV